jgi:hypothetical protein
MTLVKRLVKGSPLTFQEGDDNLQYLEDEAQKGRLYEGELDFYIVQSISSSDYTQPIGFYLSDFLGTGVQVKGILVENEFVTPGSDLGYSMTGDVKVTTVVFKGGVDVSPFEGLSDDVWQSIDYSFYSTTDISGEITSNPNEILELSAQLQIASENRGTYRFNYEDTDTTHRLFIEQFVASDRFFDNSKIIISNSGLIDFITAAPIEKVPKKVFSLQISDVEDVSGDIRVTINNFNNADSSAIQNDLSSSFTVTINSSTITPTITKLSDDSYQFLIDNADLDSVKSNISIKNDGALNGGINGLFAPEIYIEGDTPNRIKYLNLQVEMYPTFPTGEIVPNVLSTIFEVRDVGNTSLDWKGLVQGERFITSELAPDYLRFDYDSAERKEILKTYFTSTNPLGSPFFEIKDEDGDLYYPTVVVEFVYTEVPE